MRKLIHYKQKTHDIDRFKKIYGSIDKKSQTAGKVSAFSCQNVSSTYSFRNVQNILFLMNVV